MFPINTLLLRLRILVISRIFIATFFLFYAQHVYAEELVFYSVIVSILFLSAFYVLWLSVGRGLEILVWLQIILDLVLETIVIYYTGGADSLFASIYILSILSAGLILSPSASFMVAFGSSVSFILAAYFEPLQSFSNIPNPRRDAVYLFYASYVRITVFFLVAVLTYFFSQKIKKLEGKVKTQERLVYLGEVVSNIAHEIRNPLTSISGSVEVIHKQLNSQLNEKQSKMMEAVVEEAERVKNIFNGLLDYSRLPELHLEPVKLTPFLDQIFLLMTHQKCFNSKVKIDAIYRKVNDDVVLKIDAELMKQVFINLITNAYEAMADQGNLKISVEQSQDFVSIFLEDDGEGMDRKTLNTIFLPFKSGKANGTGLGLAQSHKIVSQHGGYIKFQSKKSRGTKVEVTLPTE